MDAEGRALRWRNGGDRLERRRSQVELVLWELDRRGGREIEADEEEGGLRSGGSDCLWLDQDERLRLWTAGGRDAERERYRGEPHGLQGFRQGRLAAGDVDEGEKSYRGWLRRVDHGGRRLDPSGGARGSQRGLRSVGFEAGEVGSHLSGPLGSIGGEDEGRKETGRKEMLRGERTCAAGLE